MAFVRLDQSAASDALVVADADGGHERIVSTRRRPAMYFTLTIVGRPEARPAWSPDGRAIAVLGRDLSSLHQVVFVDVATGVETVRDATGGDLIPHGVAWLGSRSLLLSEPRVNESRVQLWRMSYPDGAISAVTNDLSNYLGVSLAADRRSLATTRRETRVTLWVGDAGATSGMEVAPPSLFGGRLMSLSWAGDHLLYDSTPKGIPTIVKVKPGNGQPVEIASPALTPAATSDGRTIVFAKRGRELGLWKVDTASGGRPVQLVAGLADSPVVTPDGRQALFIFPRSGIQSPWIVPIEGGEPTEIVNSFAGLGSLDVSPDGHRLLYWTVDTKNNQKLAVCEFPGCTNRLTLALPQNWGPSSSGTRFTPDGRSMAYVDRSGLNLWALPLDGGSPRQIAQFSDRTIAAFAWSRDGKRLAVARTTTTNDIVLLKGLSP
jgi:Tol biopolymer transport system component